MRNAPKVFLTADWRDLLMLNYEVEPGLLEQFVPKGTELDTFNGKTYVSLVGFRFRNTKYRGWIPVPFHSEFAEINLRFYVRRRNGPEMRRGAEFSGDPSNLYGPALAMVLKQPPNSAFVAEGSAVSVFSGTNIC
jgi:hypothetical protein